MDATRVTVGSVVIDCNDFTAMVAFWRDALGYVVGHLVDDDFAILKDPAGTEVNVSVQKVPEPRVGKNRLHFDLYTTEPRADVERLVGLGATIHDRIPEPDEDFIVLEDPEGNLFCVVDTTH